jgi:UDP-N-acetylmuramyl pentapeptide phosphotransferase/UDP-N-acetylglucosamine-1-phosphate transferase
MIPVALASSLIFSQPPRLVLALAAGLCAVSFIDDRWGLPVFLRLIAHALAVILLCRSFEPSLATWTFALAAVTLIWSINLFNFMDGADGLAGGMALFGFSAFGWTMLDAMPAMAYLAFSLVAAAAGFLMLNFSPARVFMGDAGSVPLGFLAGGIGLTGWLQNAWPAWFPLLVFSPFVADASVTLLRRLLRRERFWQAHRDHYYQRLVRMGWPHRKLALAEYALMAACGASALAMLQMGFEFQMLGLSLWIAAYSGLMLFIDSRWAKSAASRGGQA